MKSKLRSFNKKYLVWIIFFAIILLAVFFRFYKLNVLPPGLHPDEAANGLDIFRILENRDYRIIYNTNGPREALFFYIQAIFVYFMGNTILALRMAPALLGVVSVIVIFFATKAWFNRRTALITAFFMAVTPWIVIIQRDGFRASTVPLFLGLFMWFGAKAYQTKKTVYFLLSAIAIGLGFYTYTAFSMIVVALFLGTVYMLIFRRSWISQNWKKLLLSLLVFGVVMAPLIYTTIKDPGGSTARAGGTSFLNKSLNDGKPLQTLLSSTAKTLLQYNYVGDSNNRHNLDGQPLLNTFVGIMLIVGLVASFYHFKRPRYAIVIIILASMLLPALLTAEGLPHALRSIGTAVPILMLAGVGTNYLLYVWYKSFPINHLARVVGVTTICVLLGLTLIQSYRAYFIAWAQSPKTYQAYNELAVSIANYLLANYQPNQNYYVVMGGYDANPIQYLTHNKASYQLLDQQQLMNLPIEQPKQTIVIVPVGSDHDKDIEALKIKFSNGKLIDIKSNLTGELLYSVYEVKS